MCLYFKCYPCCPSTSNPLNPLTIAKQSGSRMLQNSSDTIF